MNDSHLTTGKQKNSNRQEGGAGGEGGNQLSGGIQEEPVCGDLPEQSGDDLGKKHLKTKKRTHDPNGFGKRAC